MCEEEGLDDFHGSGSIEAEEFEDDEVDEPEGATEDDSTTIVVSSTGKLPNKATGSQLVGSLNSPQLRNITRAPQVNSSTQTTSRPDTPIAARDHCDSNFVFPPAHYRTSPKVPQTLPTGFSLSACDRHFKFFDEGTPESRTHNPCEVFHYNSVVPGHQNSSLLPSLLTAHIQSNSSYYHSELDSKSVAPNSSVQTAPVSGHASPSENQSIPSTTTETLAVPGVASICPPRPHPSTVSMYYDPASFSLVAAAAVAVAANTAQAGSSIPTGVAGSANWPNPPPLVRPSLVHSPYNLPLSKTQPHHPFSGVPLMCPLHPHSAGSSEVRSTQMIAKTESDQLTEEVVAISTASLPSLQPASRFRKARIHETVEQWCHGRLSIHDCHLKVIPDWVLDLQKKTSVLDQDISNALAQRVNCFSCLEQKALDRSGLQQSGGLTSSKGTTDVHAYPMSSQSKLNESPLRRVLNRGPSRNNLFSFWDGGTRVYCRLPKLSRVCIPPGVSESSSDLPPQPEENGILYGEKTLTAEEESTEVCTRPADSSVKVVPDSTSLLQDESLTGAASIPENISTAPAVFLPSNNADPATAYLRRQQVVAEGESNHRSTREDSLLKGGDSPSADELSLPLSDVIQSSPGSTDYANQSVRREPPPFQVTRVIAHHYSSDHSRGKEPQSFLVRKRSVLDAMPVMVPPTSPTFVDGAVGESCSSGIANNKNIGVTSGNMVNGIGLIDALPVHPKIQRILNDGGGGYHNVMPHFVTNGLPDPRSESMKPSSLPSPTGSLLSNVPYSHCSDATALMCRPLLQGAGLTNGEVGPHRISPSGLPTDPSIHPHEAKGLPSHSLCTSGSLPTIPPAKSHMVNGLDHVCTRNAKLSTLLSTRLETRINESIVSPFGFVYFFWCMFVKIM
ncbi:unnamed protein product [Echinostoma caproni]|uniref:BRCT domain-containing protein n=1 Tax=Echinostoma caproni TaxID=27848 RepID=A0A183AU89_9TREM|nr:unnamed protein product [Echinostoma caproni]